MRPNYSKKYFKTLNEKNQINKKISTKEDLFSAIDSVSSCIESIAGEKHRKYVQEDLVFMEEPLAELEYGIIKASKDMVEFGISSEELEDIKKKYFHLESLMLKVYAKKINFN